MRKYPLTPHQGLLGRQILNMDEVYHPLDRPAEDAESLSRFLKQRIRMGNGLRQLMSLVSWGHGERHLNLLCDKLMKGIMLRANAGR